MPVAVPRHLHVPASSPAASRASSSPGGQHPSVGGPDAPGAARGPWPMAAPPIDVEGLTEQVVRRIDERIVAFRERMGKPF